jgi:diguanylate cyclase (GGDEF)-like protein
MSAGVTDSRVLIALIGLGVQLGGCILLAGLFLVLRRHAAGRPYFRYWSAAWVVLAVAIGALVVRYQFVPRLDRISFTDESLEVRFLYLVYQSAKLLYVALLFAGTASFASGVRLRGFIAYATVLSIAYGGMSVIVATTLGQIALLQSAVTVLAFGGAGSMLLHIRRSRRSVGSMVAAGAYAAMALLWTTYALGFGWRYLTTSELPAVIGGVMMLNSYLDLVLQMLLGYGMVVMLLEDAKREVDAAHAELEVAHDELRRATHYDALTGALSRRAFEEGVGLDVARASFGAVAVIDLDNLKTVNDRYGHGAGDQLLRHLVSVLRDELRPTDRLYRWGGDEFLIVVPGVKASDAWERLERAIHSARPMLTTAATQPLPMLASVGAAGFGGAEDLVGAIERADAEMYRRKQQRRKTPVFVG